MTNFQGFSLKHYGELFNDKRMLAIFLNTILIALLSSVCSTIIGTMVPSRFITPNAATNERRYSPLTAFY